MYVYIYIYVYVCMYIYIYIYVYVCMYIYICICVNMYILFIIMLSRDDRVSSGHSMPGTRDGQTGRCPHLLNMRRTCFSIFFEISKYRNDPSDRSEGPS